MIYIQHMHSINSNQQGIGDKNKLETIWIIDFFLGMAWTPLIISDTIYIRKRRRKKKLHFLLTCTLWYTSWKWNCIFADVCSVVYVVKTKLHFCLRVLCGIRRKITLCFISFQYWLIYWALTPTYFIYIVAFASERGYLGS